MARKLTVSIPNPDDSGMVCELAAEMSADNAPGTAYLDLFLGDPSAGPATSILSRVTGSATRPDISSQLGTISTTLASTMLNPLPIVVTALALSDAPVTHIGLYSTPTGGMLVLSAPCSCSPPLMKGFAVQFKGGALVIDLLPSGVEPDGALVARDGAFILDRFGSFVIETR